MKTSTTLPLSASLLTLSIAVYLGLAGSWSESPTVLIETGQEMVKSGMMVRRSPSRSHRGVVAVRSQDVDSRNDQSERAGFQAEKLHGEPDWAVPFGGEFWRQPATSSAASNTGSVASKAPEVDIAGAMERVAHALSRDDESWGMTAPAYRLTIDDDVHFSPARPAKEDSLEDEPFEIEIFTASIDVGSENIYNAGRETSPWTVVGNTAQRRLDEPSGILEHYEARADGVELTWVLPERPAARGDLVIELALAGAWFAGESESGVHFADASDTTRVRVSPVKVVDATGASWDAPVKARGDRLQAIVPADLLAAATYPLAVDPVIGPEFGMDEPFVSPSEMGYDLHDLAFVDGIYFIVWKGKRGNQWLHAGTRVRASDGEILDPAGIRIPSSWNSELAAEGGQGIFLVVWDGGSTPNDALRAIRVGAADGGILDPDPLTIRPVSVRLANVSIGFNGHEFLVVWKDDSLEDPETTDIYGVRVLPDGSVLDDDAIAISTAPEGQLTPNVAAAGRQFLVAWKDRRDDPDEIIAKDIYAARVDGATGEVLDPAGLLISTSASRSSGSPSVASDGTRYLLTWIDDRNDEGDVYGARIRPSDGFRLDPAGFAIQRWPGFQQQVSVASNESGYLVAWETRHDDHSLDAIHTATLDDSGNLPLIQWNPAPLDSEPHDYYRGISMASDGHDYLVAWGEGWSGSIPNGDVSAIRVSGTTGHLLEPPFPVRLFVNHQFSRTVASSGDEHLVVWSDLDQDAAWTLYGARFRASDGALLDPTGIVISQTMVSEDSVPPNGFAADVASDGQDFLVVWERHEQLSAAIAGARVRGIDGLLLDETSIEISGPLSLPRSEPAVSSNGSTYLVIWTDGMDTPEESESLIYGTRIRSSDGAVLDSIDEPIGIPLAEPGIVDVVNDNGDFGIGQNEDTFHISIGGVGGDARRGKFQHPDVASDGADYFVVWDAFGLGITGVAVNGDSGTPQHGLQTVVAEGVLSHPAVTFGSGRYLVAWRTTDVDGAAGVEATLVRPSDLTPEEQIVSLSRTAAPARKAPTVASNGEHFLVVWEDIRDLANNQLVTNLYGAPISISWLPSGSLHTDVGNDALLQLQGADPALCSAPDESFFLVYHRADDALDAEQFKGRLIRFTSETPDLMASSDTGSSSRDNITKDASPTFSGSAEPFATIDILFGGTTVGHAPVDESGRWIFTSPFVLVDGVYPVHCRAHDSAGFPLLVSDPLMITIDTSAPDTRITSVVAGYELEDGATTTADGITLHLRAAGESASRFVASIDGAPFARCDNPAEFSALSPGKHQVNVRAIDLAGNRDRTAARFKWWILHSAPDAPDTVERLDRAGRKLEDLLNGPVSRDQPLGEIDVVDLWGIPDGPATQDVTPQQEIDRQAGIDRPAPSVGRNQRLGGATPPKVPLRP